MERLEFLQMHALPPQRKRDSTLVQAVNKWVHHGICQAQRAYSTAQKSRNTALAESFRNVNNGSWKTKQKRNSKNAKQCPGKSRVAGIKAVAGVECVLFSRCAYHSTSYFNITDTVAKMRDSATPTSKSAADRLIKRRQARR
ncbi:hypothetical protein P5673_030916 [Acropora cervicornis]|uniref:Uncharacterized protein n=1 Tax=Acropora cervicornis TaxID=6130 RepID=A0AAD9PTF2_ACRCE|nr:hypothetical protein P5673_030916 [Acropora cervicornis]